MNSESYINRSMSNKVQIGSVRRAVSSNFKFELASNFKNYMIFHLLCPGFWRLLETGLRFCAHTGGVQDKNAVAVLGSCGSWMDRVVLGWIVQCSWISWISPAPMAIFNKLCEILDCILDI